MFYTPTENFTLLPSNILLVTITIEHKQLIRSVADSLFSSHVCLKALLQTMG